MRNIKSISNFLNEDKTLFGDTAEGLVKKLKSWDALQFKESGRYETLGSTPAAKEVSVKKERDRGVYPYASFRADSEFRAEFNTPTNVVKAVSKYLFGASSKWTQTKIGPGQYAKSEGDRNTRAQAFAHPALGTILISCKTKTGRFDSDMFYCEVLFMKDKKDVGNINPELASRVDTLMSTLKTKEEKLSVARYIRDRYAEFTDTI